MARVAKQNLVETREKRNCISICYIHMHDKEDMPGASLRSEINA